jgi:hypothetical protein
MPDRRRSPITAGQQRRPGFGTPQAAAAIAHAAPAALFVPALRNPLDPRLSGWGDPGC